MQHGVNCKCDWCHGLKIDVLTRPGRHGRSGGCTDCGGPVESPPRKPHYFPLCKACVFERYGAINFGLQIWICKVVHESLGRLGLLERGECLGGCGLGDVVRIRSDADFDSSDYGGTCVTCYARRLFDEAF